MLEYDIIYMMYGWGRQSRGKSYIDFRLRMLKYNNNNNNPSSKHVLVYLAESQKQHKMTMRPKNHTILYFKGS